MAPYPFRFLLWSTRSAAWSGSQRSDLAGITLGHHVTPGWLAAQQGPNVNTMHYNNNCGGGGDEARLVSLARNR